MRAHVCVWRGVVFIIYYMYERERSFVSRSKHFNFYLSIFSASWERGELVYSSTSSIDSCQKLLWFHFPYEFPSVTRWSNGYYPIIYVLDLSSSLLLVRLVSHSRLCQAIFLLCHSTHRSVVSKPWFLKAALPERFPGLRVTHSVE